jgi:hypothetical protein
MSNEIIHCGNLLGDTLYLLAPLKQYIGDRKDVTLVAYRNLGGEMVSRSFPHLKTRILIRDDENYTIRLGAGTAAQKCKENKQDLHLSEGYGKLLGIKAEDFLPPCTDWKVKSKYTQKDLIALVPFSVSCSSHTDELANKEIPLRKWMVIIETLKVHNMAFTFVCGPSDKVEYPELRDYPTFTAKTLPELQEFLESTSLIVTVVNGLCHMSSALGCNVIVLWPEIEGGMNFIAPVYNKSTFFVAIGNPNRVNDDYLKTSIHYASYLLLKRPNLIYKKNDGQVVLTKTW